jgi:hypothetical protein
MAAQRYYCCPGARDDVVHFDNNTNKLKSLQIVILDPVKASAANSLVQATEPVSETRVSHCKEETKQNRKN